jgi:hypothetical protein
MNHYSVSGEPRFPSHLFLEQRSPPPPPPPPTLLNSSHPVPTQSPLPFTQPGPAFNQQGQQPVFPRERPVRPALQPPGPVGILHFSQPGSATARPFIPPRQPFLPSPGQPFLPTHAQPNLQVCTWASLEGNHASMVLSLCVSWKRSFGFCFC